ncbi:MAG: ABC transporter permease [Saccharofermentans sp.]|nr:ABC transporter permease [Saccharofermentans sp.]
MSKMAVLYKAELRKILSKKSVWIALLLSLALVLLVGFTNFSADGKGVYVKQQEKTLGAISGQKMDDEFFEMFHSTVQKELDEHPDQYNSLLEYDRGEAYKRAAESAGMKALYDVIYNTVRSKDAVIDVTADEFYEKMRKDIESDGLELGCTQEEVDEWLQWFDKVEKPIEYSYALSYQNVLDVLFIIGWALILNIAIALSGVFADEKTHRTDAMILSAKNGRTPICLVKIAASITAALLQTLVLLGSCIGIEFLFYGADGWNAPIQIIIPSSPWNITIGEMILIYAGLAILSSIFFAITNMVLSHLTKSAVATMAIHAGIIFAGLFNVPSKLGLIAKLWQLRPSMALYYGTFCNTYRYGVFNNVELTTILYLGLSIILVLFLVLSYKKSQVQSR